MSPPGRVHWKSERLWALIAAFLVALVTAFRLYEIRRATYPGHADPAFYYNVAQNLDSGKGPTVDYTWEFLTGLHPLPHYAFDYWLPMSSFLMWVGVHLSHRLSGALVVTVLMSVVLAAGTYWLARGLTDSPWVPAAAAAAVTVQPVITQYSVQTESAIYLAAFAVLALAAAVAARTRAWLWAVAGVLAGLANLSRNEGLLLIVVLVIAAAAFPGPLRRWATVAATAGGYVVAMLPLYAMNQIYVGSPLLPTFGKVPFITRYEDLFSLHVDASLPALLRDGLVPFVVLRASSLMNEITAAFGAMLPLDAVLALLVFGWALSGIRYARPSADAIPQRMENEIVSGAARLASSRWFTPVGFSVLVVLFYAVVVPVVSSAGGVNKVMATIVPVVVIATFVQLAKLSLNPRVLAAFVAVFVLGPLVTLPSTGHDLIVANNSIGNAAAAMTASLRQEQSCIGRNVVLMTRNPWEITQATGFPTVMIPNAPLNDILAVASRYGVTDIQLHASRAWALDAAVKQADAGSGPLSPAPTFPAHTVYRIRTETPNNTC